MKITDVNVVTKGLPRSNTILIQVKSDEGFTGIGATYAEQGLGKSDIDDFIDIGERSLRNILVGIDPRIKLTGSGREGSV